MKRKTMIILAIMAILVLGLAVLYMGIQKNLSALSAMQIEDIPLDQVADGVYVGEYGVFPVVAQVEVAVKDHRIASARILKHQNGQGSAGEDVVDRAVQSGSLRVDTVNGATYSSKVLLKAMENALREGLVP